MNKKCMPKSNLNIFGYKTEIIGFCHIYPKKKKKKVDNNMGKDVDLLSFFFFGCNLIQISHLSITV